MQTPQNISGVSSASMASSALDTSGAPMTLMSGNASATAIGKISVANVSTMVNEKDSTAAAALFDPSELDRTSMVDAGIALDHLQAKNIEAMKMRTQSRVFAQDQMREFVSRVGIDLSKLNVVHVAGSKGKGSVCAFTESILNTHGFKTGLYASPHLISLTERFRINTKQVDEKTFLKHFWRVWDRLWATRETAAAANQPEMPPYFTFLTLVGFDLFIGQGVDVLVLEVGLGGKLDATNIIKSPLVTAVTFLALEHTEILGNSYALIAAEKAGIFKQDVPAVTVPQILEAMRELERVASEVGAPLSVARRFRAENTVAAEEFSPSSSFNKGEEQKEDTSRSCVLVDDGESDLDHLVPKLGLLGQHQFQNASLAVSLAHAALLRLKEKYEADSEGSGIRPEAYEIAKKACSVVQFPPERERVARMFPIMPNSSRSSTSGELEADITPLTLSKYRDTTLVLPCPTWSNLPPYFRSGLRRTVWPGRCQIIKETGEENLTFYLDGAHTGPSIELCMDWFTQEMVQENFQPGDVNVLLFNCGQVRDPFVLLQPLADPHKPRVGIPSTPTSGSPNCSDAEMSESYYSGDLSHALTDTGKIPHFNHVLFTPFDHDRQYLFGPQTLEVLAKSCSHRVSEASLDVAKCPSSTPELAWQYTLLGAWHSIIHDRPDHSLKLTTYDGKCIGSVGEAISNIRSLARANPNVRVRALVTGSLYLVGNVLKSLAFKI